MNTLKSILKELLSDNSGGLSTIRILSIGWVLLVAIVWAVVALKTRTMPDIPGGVLALSGVIVGGKVVQRFGEREGIS
jgi:Na+/H+ antiporter NhaB